MTVVSVDYKLRSNMTTGALWVHCNGGGREAMPKPKPEPKPEPEPKPKPKSKNCNPITERCDGRYLVLRVIMSTTPCVLCVRNTLQLKIPRNLETPGITDICQPAAENRTN